MSVSISNAGTNYTTYAVNPSRSGDWSTYLADLALQNSHDRQKVNGEFNYRSGVIDSKPLTDNRIKTSKTKVVNPKTRKVSKKNYNPRYFYSGA
jgi:hypothetical protein